ncbi:MAG: cell division protein FtsQ [Prevotella sp.]|nr:cell division protein FtsQ [Prevotella sp.]
MTINWKSILYVALDIILGVYLVAAMTSFNNPDEKAVVCNKVDIRIGGAQSAGFLSTVEVKNLMQKKGLYPLNKPMASVNPRTIEDLLKCSPFVQTAECYKTKDGHVCITITQRLPIVRIKSDSGADYYLDDNGGIMPNSAYTSDLIIATGHINNWFAGNYITPLTKAIMASPLWNNQVEQINVLPDLGIEIVPRVGEHVVFLGYLPQYKDTAKRQKEIKKFVEKKFTRLEKFYRYGLSKAGWNKYSYISLEFDNQIICKKKS